MGGYASLQECWNQLERVFLSSLQVLLGVHLINSCLCMEKDMASSGPILLLRKNLPSFSEGGSFPQQKISSISKDPC